MSTAVGKYLYSLKHVGAELYKPLHIKYELRPTHEQPCGNAKEEYYLQERTVFHSYWALFFDVYFHTVACVKKYAGSLCGCCHAFGLRKMPFSI